MDTSSSTQMTVHQILVRIGDVLGKQEKTLHDLNTKLSLLTTTRSAVGLSAPQNVAGSSSTSVAERVAALNSISASGNGPIYHRGSAPSSASIGTESQATPAAVVVQLPFLNMHSSPPVGAVDLPQHGVPIAASTSSCVAEPPVVVRAAVHKVRPLMVDATPTVGRKSSSIQQREGITASPLAKRSVQPMSARGTGSRKLKQSQMAAGAQCAIRSRVVSGASLEVKAGAPKAQPAPKSTPMETTKSTGLTRSSTLPRASSIKRANEGSPAGIGATTTSRASTGSTNHGYTQKVKKSPNQPTRQLNSSTKRHLHAQNDGWDLLQRMKELEDIRATNTEALERTHSATYGRSHSFKTRTAESSPARGAVRNAPCFATLEDMQKAAALEDGSGGDAQEPQARVHSRRGSTASGAGSSRKLTAHRLAAKSPRVRGFGVRLGMAYVAIQQLHHAEYESGGAAGGEDEPCEVSDAPKKRVVHIDPSTSLSKAPALKPGVSRVGLASTSPMPPPRGFSGKKSGSKPPWSTTTKVVKVDPLPLGRTERSADGVEARNIVQVKKGQRRQEVGNAPQ